MGLVNVPEINLYWSKDNLYHNDFISKIMPRDRFLLILRCWHFADNALDTGEDRLFKIRPILDPIILNFQKYLIPEQILVIDKSLMPWRGRLIFKQYIKNKSHKYGIKMYKLCTVSGYILNMKIYTGKSLDNTSGKGHPEAVVINLQNYVNSGRTLYCDNFYTSINLAANLLNKKTRLCH